VAGVEAATPAVGLSMKTQSFCPIWNRCQFFTGWRAVSGRTRGGVGPRHCGLLTTELLARLPLAEWSLRLLQSARQLSLQAGARQSLDLITELDFD